MERKHASEYPQELLDIFHEYQHGEIDRRTFMDRIGKFAVGGLTAAAIFESLTPNYAWAQQVPKDDARIKTSVERAVATGQRQHQGAARASANASAKVPAVIVIHENRGLNPYVEDVARRFAVANFIAYAPRRPDVGRRLSRQRRAGCGEVPRGQRSEDVRGFRRGRDVAEVASAVQRQARRHRFLLRRRHREPARRTVGF